MHGIVVYFSRAGENYGVGVVEKGNTRVLAERIAAVSGSDLFEIRPQRPYPQNYEQCLAAARRDQAAAARPALDGMPDSLPAHDTLFLGTPIWWEDLPMPVYAFLENADLSGMVIAPFCTHEGGGFEGADRKIAALCPTAARVTPPLFMYGHDAQQGGSAAEQAVRAWLEHIGLA